MKKKKIPTMDFIIATRMISTTQTDEKEITNRIEKVLCELIFDLVRPIVRFFYLKLILHLITRWYELLTRIILRANARK